MSKSSHIRVEDCRAIFRLCGECRELGDDSVRWRQHSFAGLAKLAGADLVIGGELLGLKRGMPRDLGTADWGWDHGYDRRGWTRALELLQSDPTYSTMLTEYGRRMVDHEGVALRRTDMAEDRSWACSIECQEVFRTMGVDHAVYCLCSVPGTEDEVTGGFLLRGTGRPDFNPRETAIFRTASGLVAELVGGPLARFKEPSPSELSPQVRRVLRCLLEGDSDKQIAARMKLSRYTVNQYTKIIYRHFRTGGRHELMARWIRRGWGGSFDWANE